MTGIKDTKPIQTHLIIVCGCSILLYSWSIVWIVFYTFPLWVYSACREEILNVTCRLFGMKQLKTMKQCLRSCIRLHLPRWHRVTSTAAPTTSSHWRPCWPASALLLPYPSTGVWQGPTLQAEMKWLLLLTYWISTAISLSATVSVRLFCLVYVQLHEVRIQLKLVLGSFALQVHGHHLSPEDAWVGEGHHRSLAVVMTFPLCCPAGPSTTWPGLIWLMIWKIPFNS